MTIKKLQRAFHDMVFQHKKPYELESQLVSYTRDELQERLAIYRNNVFYSLIEALGDIYESIAPMVGREFFNALAKAYIENHPPQQAAMVFLGEDFPQFLADFEHAKPLPYLADLACLDWARHCAYNAAEATPLQPEAFALIAPSHLQRARLTLHPSCQLLSSHHAVFSLWQFAHSEDENRSPDFDCDVCEAVFVLRPDSEVHTYHISLSMLTMLQTLLAGECLESALGQAMKCSDAEFDASEAMAFLIGSRAIVGITPGDTHESR